MKEEYVSYECAVKLKELGFDWDVNKVYHRPSTLAEWELFPWHSEYNDWNNEGKFYISAPTLSLAQKWLREKHCLSVEPICNMVRQWNVNVCEIDNFGIAVYSKMNLETYELALSKGIDKALELLTIKSNGK